MSGLAAMRRRLSPGRRLVLVLVFLLPLAGCSGGGGECDTCSSDEDCDAGLVCSTFDDGSMRCASGVGATTCRVR